LNQAAQFTLHLIWEVECSFATFSGHKLLTAIMLNKVSI